MSTPYPALADHLPTTADKQKLCYSNQWIVTTTVGYTVQKKINQTTN